MDFFVSETWGIAEILKYIEKKLLVKDAPSGTCMNIVYWGQTGFFFGIGWRVNEFITVLANSLSQALYG